MDWGGAWAQGTPFASLRGVGVTILDAVRVDWGGAWAQGTRKPCVLWCKLRFPWNSKFSEVPDLSSTGHFVDLGQENASAWSPPPEAYLEKHRPRARATTRQDKTRQDDKPESHI